MKLKKEVVDLKYGLKEVMQLNPISYKWKNNSIGKTTIPDQFQETKLGFSAQQLQEVLPEVVETHSWYPKDEEGNFERKQNENLGVRYAEITPVLVKAIQEQQEQIESLKVTIEELKKQNEMLLKLMEKK
jgi:predicted RNase H-like nuclease (RuvC/YqgF family)